MLATVVISYASGETHRVCGKGFEDAKDLEGCKVPYKFKMEGGCRK